MHSSRRVQRVTVEPRRARFEHERACLTSINPPAAGNLLIAAAIPPRDRHHSMPGSSECSNVGFLVLRSSDFQSDAALATPIHLHLHMVSLALVRQEHELARSARNAGTFNSCSLKHPHPDAMRTSICMPSLTQAGVNPSLIAKACRPARLSLTRPCILCA